MTMFHSPRARNGQEEPRTGPFRCLFLTVSRGEKDGESPPRPEWTNTPHAAQDCYRGDAASRQTKSPSRATRRRALNFPRLLQAITKPILKQQQQPRQSIQGILRITEIGNLRILLAYLPARPFPPSIVYPNQSVVPPAQSHHDYPIPGYLAFFCNFIFIANGSQTCVNPRVAAISCAFKCGASSPGENSRRSSPSCPCP